MRAQQFHRGDHVKIADDLGSTMSHFASGVDALVIGSYADQYGGSNTDSFTLLLRGSGTSSWYYAKQLTLIEAGRADLIDDWQLEIDAERNMHADIDWVFASGDEVIEKGYGASVQALANCLGMGSLWGARGEGVDYYMNGMRVMTMAKPFLESGDKDGWLIFCEGWKPHG